MRVKFWVVYACRVAMSVGEVYGYGEVTGGDAALFLDLGHALEHWQGERWRFGLC